MILTIALGLFTTLFGVALGCTVLELTVRALVYKLNRPSAAGSRAQGVVRPGGGSRWQTNAWE